jgi:signal transduction histidine kinase
MLSSHSASLGKGKIGMAARPAEHGPLGVALLHHLTTDSARLIAARWAAGALVVAGSALCARVLKLPVPEMALYAVGLAVLLYNAGLFWLGRLAQLPDVLPHLRRARRAAAAQVGLDALALGAGLHLTGGVHSPAVALIPVHALIAAALIPGWPGLLAAASGVAALGLVAGLEQAGILPHYALLPALPADLHTSPLLIGIELVAVALAAGIAAVAASRAARRLLDRERRIATLLHASEAALTTRVTADLMQHLTREAAATLGGHGALIRLLGEDEEELAIVSASGLSEAYLHKGTVDLTHSDVDGGALAGHPAVIDDVLHDARLQYHDQIEAEGIHSLLVAPIIGQGKPLGVLRVYADRPGQFAPPDVDFALGLARQGAIALESARSCDDLKRANDERTQFVQIVTHELRSPVAGSQVLLRTMLRGMAGDLNDQQRDLLDRIEARLDLLAALINDLLDLAASKTMDVEQPVGRLPLQPVLRQVIDRYAPEATAKTIEMECDIPFEVIAVRGTEDGLARIFSNLVGNAIKYTPAGGRVSVRVVERPAGVVVTVSDSGIGIPEEDLPLLWQDFFRARNARRSGIPGTGLGLSIVRQLVDRFGGLISVQSVEGKGTTFKVTLQQASPADDAAP